jgi:hypothetical protein
MRREENTFAAYDVSLSTVTTELKKIIFIQLITVLFFIYEYINQLLKCNDL